MRLRLGSILAVLLYAAAGSPQPAIAAPKVVASIKPLHSLVAGVMQGVGEPYLLVAGGGSPHTYALRPSQSRALQQADLVFWIGPELETFLVKPLSNLALSGTVAGLAQAENILLLATRPPGIVDTGQTNAQDHLHATTDMHIWLDPRNAAAMVQAIARQLADTDPAHASIYRTNSTVMQVRLKALERQIAGELAAPLAHYMVFHDAYGYFEARFGVAPTAVVSIDPERPPGAARIRALKNRITQTNTTCIFAEPQFEPKIAGRLAEGTNARLGVLDPLGADIKDGGDLYFKLMGDLARNLRACAADTPTR